MKLFGSYFLLYFLLDYKCSCSSAEDELAVKEPELLKGVRCAGQLEGEDECSTGLCYDSININNDFVQTGCAAESICKASGCALSSNTEQFVCCCAYPYCNGKSHRMVKARWRMFQNGDYRQPTPRKPATRSATSRLLPRNVAVETVKVNTTTNIPAKSTPSTIPSSKSPGNSQKVFNRSANAEATLNKTSSAVVPSRKSTKSVANTTKKAVVNSSTAKPITKVLSTMKVVATSTIGARAPGPTKAANRATSSSSTRLPEYTITTTSAVTTVTETSTTMASTTTVIGTSLGTTNTIMPTTTKVAIKKNTEKLEIKSSISPSSSPSIITQNLTSRLQTSPTATGINDTSKQSPTTTESISTSTTTLPTPSNTTTTIEGNKRSTRAPAKQPKVIYQLPISYPWYWICLLGFGSAALVFLAVFACLRRCGKCRRGSVDRTERLQEEENYSNGYNNEGNTTIIKDGKRKVKRRTENSLIKSKHLVNGTTNESLVSRCTTVTTASNNAYSDACFGEDDGLGRELTVIDPLLNKSFSGTLQGDNTTKH